MMQNLHQLIIKHWWRHLLVLAVLIVLINLGMWQLRRLDERREYNRAVQAGLDQPPVALTGGRPVDPDALYLRRVMVTGTFDNAESVILNGRTFQGRQGAELLVPLRIANSRQAVLVNRGWIPLETSDSEARRQFAVKGEVTVEGIAYRSQPQLTGLFNSASPTPPTKRRDLWVRADIDRIQQQLDYPLLPIFVQQSPDTNSNSPPLRKENIDLGEGAHLSYALQWFTFGLILVVIYGAFVWQEWKKENGP